MKRTAVIKRIRDEARKRGLPFTEGNLSRHGTVTVGQTTRTLGRHAEIDDLAARRFFDQFANEFGKGWWR